MNQTVGEGCRGLQLEAIDLRKMGSRTIDRDKAMLSLADGDLSTSEVSGGA
jgi:hypothetical protein